MEFGSDDDLLRMAASLEQHREHTLARTVVDDAKDKMVLQSSVDESDSITGHGVCGKVE